MKNNNLNVVFAVLFLFGFMFLWETLVMSRYNKPLPTAQKQQAVNDAAADATIREAAATPAAPAAVRTGNDAIVTLEAAGNKVTLLAEGAKVGSWQIQERDHWIETGFPEKNRVASPLETFPDLTYASQRVSDTEVVFTAVHPAGFQVRKTFKLLATPPFHALTLEISNPTAKELLAATPLAWGNGLDKHPVGTPYDKDTVRAENRAVALGQKLFSWRPGLIFGRRVDRTDDGSFEWVGVDNRHFLAAIVAPQGQTLPNIHVSVNREHPPVAGTMIDGTLKPGEKIQRDYLIYVGPKQSAALQAAGHRLVEAIDYGTFGFISKALLAALNFFHKATNNYGWAIVLLTFTIQIVLFPLTKKSLEHSVRMKEFQPHLKKLQEQFKDDPKRYQIEMMNFYRKNGMRFMGLEGCLPMLLQMPVFFAFYTTLNNAYDLRGAPWILWITDLAAKDPHHVLPIIMGCGMFLQQKLSGTAMDPAQARMMMIMPIMFTFMFLSMPAGLVLYWVVNSFVTIVVQRILTWRAHQHPPAVVV